MADEPRNNAESTRRAMPEGKRFQPGNPGRPKGSRNKLGEDFIRALHEDFSEHGVAAIQAVRVDKPDAYLKVIASLLPRELKVTTETEMTDDQLIERIQQLDAIIRPFLGLEGEGGVSSGGEAPLRPN